MNKIKRINFLFFIIISSLFIIGLLIICFLIYIPQRDVIEELSNEKSELKSRIINLLEIVRSKNDEIENLQKENISNYVYILKDSGEYDMDWLSYTNEAYNFDLKYPSNWSLSETGDYEYSTYTVMLNSSQTSMKRCHSLPYACSEDIRIDILTC